MLLDAEAKVAVVGEVLFPQLILLHLEAPLQDFLSLFQDCFVLIVENPLLNNVQFVFDQLAVLCLIILIRRKMVMRTIIIS